MRILKTMTMAQDKRQVKRDISHPVKKTSLSYLAEALSREQYEQCPEMISIALEFGANPKEIESIISGYVRHDRSDFSPVPQWLEE